MAVIENLPVAMPLPAEQEPIVGRIGRATEALEALIADSTRAIDLLKGRRAALISAAVTGQIDVRAIAHAKGRWPRFSLRGAFGGAST